MLVCTRTWFNVSKTFALCVGGEEGGATEHAGKQMQIQAGGQTGRQANKMTGLKLEMEVAGGTLNGVSLTTCYFLLRFVLSWKYDPIWKLKKRRSSKEFCRIARIASWIQNESSRTERIPKRDSWRNLLLPPPTHHHHRNPQRHLLALTSLLTRHDQK